jgi:hypothetical protein
MCDEVEIKMQFCAIGNGYRGHDELSEIAATDSNRAAGICWGVMCGHGDPGHDDHALCIELSEILIACLGDSEFESKVIHSWVVFSEEIKENFVAGLASDSLNLEFVLRLFDHPASSVAIRHQIAAVLASARFPEARRVLEFMLDRIGIYDNRQKQQSLSRFRKDLENLLS